MERVGYSENMDGGSNPEQEPPKLGRRDFLKKAGVHVLGVTLIGGIIAAIGHAFNKPDETGIDLGKKEGGKFMASDGKLGRFPKVEIEDIDVKLVDRPTSTPEPTPTQALWQRKAVTAIPTKDTKGN